MNDIIFHFFEKFEPDFFSEDQGSLSGRKLDENKIQRQILDCLGALRQLKSKNGTLKCLQSKIFFSAVSSIVYLDDSDEITAASSDDTDKIDEQVDIIMRTFPPADYSPAASVFRHGQKVLQARPQQDATAWLYMHWAGCVGARLTHEDLRSLIEANPQAIQSIDGKKYKATPAHYAAAARKPNICYVSLMAEACPRVAYLKDENGWLMLHYAAARSDSVEMLELLLQLNVSATFTATTDIGGSLPIHLLVMRSNLPAENKIAMMKCLFEADPDSATALNAQGDTILHIICRTVDSGCDSLVRLCSDFAPGLAAIAGAGGSIPLHVLGDEKFDKVNLTLVFNRLLDAFKEGAAVAAADGSLPSHKITERLCLADIQRLVDAYPAALAVCTDNWGYPLCQAAARNDADGLAVVEYLYGKRPESTKKGSESGWTALHFAAKFGSLEILKFLASVNPEAVATGPYLPLHILIVRFITDKDSSHARQYEEKLRFLLRCYPEAAIAIDDVGCSPYSTMTTHGVSDRFKRLLLRADPTIDPAMLYRLNYAERRMAMFLVFSAIPLSFTNSFVVRLRRVKNKDLTLLRLTVSFL